MYICALQLKRLNNFLPARAKVCLHREWMLYPKCRQIRKGQFLKLQAAVGYLQRVVLSTGAELNSEALEKELLSSL